MLILLLTLNYHFNELAAEPTATLPAATEFPATGIQYKISGTLGAFVIAIVVGVVGLLISIILSCTKIKHRITLQKDQSFDNMDLNELDNLDE